MTEEELKNAKYITNYVEQLQGYIKIIENNNEITEEMLQKIGKYKQEAHQLIEERQKILNAINNINNYRIKTAIILFYFRGHTWADVATSLNSNDTSDSIRIAVKRYIKSL